MEYLIQTTVDLPSVAKKILEDFSSERIFLLYGSMGAGKTTLITALCKHLGVIDTPTSPTYAIVNEYRAASGKVYHFDFYRLEDETEAYDLGYEEYFYSGNYCFIEWPSQIPNILPSDALEIHINIQADGARTLLVKK